MADLAEYLQRNALDPEPEGERGMLLPIMRHGNKLSPAVPGIVHEPYQALSRLLQGGYSPGAGDEQGVKDAASVAGVVGLSGLGMAAPAGSLAANGARRFTLDYFGKPVQMLENPTEKALAAFLGRTKYKAARRITDDATGDVYVWDAADPALHEMVAKTLGIAKHSKDTIGLD
jgi:hypothetical protein